MRRRSTGLIAYLLVSTVWVTAVSASNFLEIVFDRYEPTPGMALYDIRVGVNKDDGATCNLVTPAGTYVLSDTGGWFSPKLDFDQDHTGMVWAGMTEAISGGWTLTWDAGLPGEVVATISFGSVLETDFPPTPTIVSPSDGQTIEIPGDPNPPRVEWSFSDTAACDPDLEITVNLFEQAGEEIQSGELLCDVLSWTPPSPLAAGTWLFHVANVNAGYRDVPVGIDIIEGIWTLENSGWLSLRSTDSSENSVEPTAFDFSNYYPLNAGGSWTYVDDFNPGPVSVDSVHEFHDISGQPAVRYATRDVQLICWNDGTSVTWYGFIEGPDTTYFNQNLVLGSLEDGETFNIYCPDTLCSGNLIRVWDALDPVAASAYGIDPGYGELIVWATYDDDEAPNSQNAIIESNLPSGVVPPPGAVTDLEWYQLGVGLTVHIGVNASTGTLSSKHVLVAVTGARDDRGVPPTSALHQNIPNPFNPSTVIRYDVARSGHVNLRVYNVRGTLVRVLEDRDRPPGLHEVGWNGENSRGERVASGVYFYRLTTQGYAQTRKMVLLK